ncbi:PEP-CTERM sorting domain-containing protein [Pelagicoccus albus]|uniref:PEP-CTERM sorting domain-containing protein n=1 Tax=Pelagicoccus albus TaxID=415222 RepID=A0A7X1B659_9BACT|nr:PEP-CTERM sorting domain-containing protein [Pelagicoccus albus]MBC2606257.1 PEP-CTERM sorting domain-containing protein [Pelagicoccus albus]
MNKTLKSALWALGALFASSPFYAQESTSLFSFDFSSGLAVTDSVSGVDVSDWSVGSTATVSESLTLTGGSSTLFTFTPTSGFQIDLSELTFNTSKIQAPDSTKGNGAGSVKFTLTLSGENFDEALEIFGNAEASSSGGSQSYTFEDASSLTGANIFTLTTASSEGALVLDNFEVLGTVSAVPEPATVFALLAGGFVSFYVARNRRRSVA